MIKWFLLALVVSNGSKILNWKQITTALQGQKSLVLSCVQWFKDTKLKANHNHFCIHRFPAFVVSNGSKILNWKQITTRRQHPNWWRCCVQWFKDTKLKANHNKRRRTIFMLLVVSNGSKILNWKQITTLISSLFWFYSCVRWFKNTKMKTNYSNKF